MQQAISSLSSGSFISVPHGKECLYNIQFFNIKSAWKELLLLLTLSLLQACFHFKQIYTDHLEPENLPSALLRNVIRHSRESVCRSESCFGEGWSGRFVVCGAFAIHTPFWLCTPLWPYSAALYFFYLCSIFIALILKIFFRHRGRISILWMTGYAGFDG